ncbi:MAG: di-trans,poly-cis-decaprenylcistransferase [Xanthomonadales bacterium]|nr:di-trans,poly-cis-decaprenylcistransferase [Xanthomonadales bacterium]
MGHQAGVRALRKTVEHAIKRGIQTLTVFAFSSENWKRPESEVRRLMDLFMRALDKEVEALRDNGVQLHFIGDRSAFKKSLRESMDQAEALTREASAMTLNVAVNYGGRWDITRAARAIARSVMAGRIKPGDVDEDMMSTMMATGDCKDPDLFIRTGGEIRVSNFLLWQSAYSELYFTPVLWPDFGAGELDAAIEVYQQRERRFGLTGQQLKGARHA